MVGSLLSVFLMGLLPVWGLQSGAEAALPSVSVAPPAARTLDRAQSTALRRSLSASGIVVTDLASGQTIFEVDADEPRPMASLTKLMTALLIVERHSLDEVVTVPQDINDVQGNIANLPPGDRFTVGDLLSALLIMSANDAAVTLARFHSGSQSAFVQEMNARALALGLRRTVFGNPTGLDAGDQKSSPRDLAWLTIYALRRTPIADRMGMRGAQIKSREGNVLYLTHTHALLHADSSVRTGQPGLPVVRAGKTGTTDAAGQCLLSIVEADGRRYVVVLLRSLDRYGDMRLVLDTLTN